MTEARFFIDHGMIHDRVTGRHVTTAPDDETWHGVTVTGACELLNSLARPPSLPDDLRATLAFVEDAFIGLAKGEYSPTGGTAERALSQVRDALRSLGGEG